MQELLDRLQKIVAAYNPRRKDSHIRALRALSPVVKACRQYIKDNSATDKGCAQRLVRQLDLIICALPDFRHFADDAHLRHTRRLAEEHLDEIENHLKGMVSQDEKRKKDSMRAWVSEHPVFKELTHIAVKKPLPKEAYVLLFERNAEGELVLLTREARDMVLTRFRPKEFSDELHLHKLYHGKAPVVGAAVIAQRELLAAIGQLPAPAEGKTQADVLLALSKQAASQPANEFLERQPVLKQLHELAVRRELPKDAYILLFREEGELVTRRGNEANRVLTRYWPSEFVAPYKIFDNLKAEGKLAGAAVIKEKELLQAIGEVPQPADENQSHLDVLLGTSTSAVEKPAADFLAGHDIFRSLHDLACGESPPRDAYALLFFESPAGRLEMLNDRGVRFGLHDFRSVRFVFDRFGGAGAPNVVGASVVGEEPPRTPARAARASDDAKGKPLRDDKRERHHDRDAGATRRFSVVAAYGRTPLKQSLLATAENFRRLGFEHAAPPEPRRDHKQGKHFGNKRRTDKDHRAKQDKAD